MRFQPIAEFTPLWRRYNRAHLSFLARGQQAPDVPLWSLATKSYRRLSGPRHGNLLALEKDLI